MKKILSSCVVAFLLALCSTNPLYAQNVLLAGWNVAGTQALGGLSPLPATVTAPNVLTSGLKRASGMLSGLATTTDNWGTYYTFGNASNTAANAAANNAFYYFTVQATPGNVLSLDSLNLYYMRYTAQCATSVTIQYGIDSAGFTDLYTHTVPSAVSATGYVLPTLNLGGVAALQNVPAASKVWFRIIPVYFQSVSWQATWCVSNQNTNASFNSGCDLFVRGRSDVLCNTVTPGTIGSSAGNTFCGTATTTLSLTGATSAGVNYQWKSSPTGTGSWTNTGANAATLSISGLSSTTYYKCIVACANGAAIDSTPVFALTANPVVTPTISIAANPGTLVCNGTAVTFTATAGGGGAAPSYQWKKNGANVGTNAPTYTDNTLVSGDVITCVLGSSAPCASPASLTSAPLTMTVSGTVIPSVTIAAVPGTSIQPGQSVVFTATGANGGSSPSYQWKKNGLAIPGATGSTYITSALANGDVISCVLHSNFPCATPDSAQSNVLNMSVVPVTACAVPLSLLMTDLTPSSAVFRWRKVTGAIGYEYVLNTSVAAPAGSGTSTTDTFYAVNSMAGSYYFHVRTLCAGGNKSSWISIPVVFTYTSAGSVSGRMALALYPNPNNGTFTLEGTVAAQELQAEVLNSIGQQVWSQTLVCPGGRLKQTLSVPVSASGVYLLRLRAGNAAETLRLVIGR